MPNLKNKLPLLLAAVGLVILLPTFFMDSEPDVPEIPEDLLGVFIDSPAVTLPAFTLKDHESKVFGNESLQGKWSLVFFGYTSCPDVCPTTMAVLEKLSRDKTAPEGTQTVFISVDPKRDTPEVLKEYVGYFGDDFIGATGPKEELDKFKDPLGVIYGYEGDLNSDEYIVNHFGAVHIIDPQGRQRAYILPPHSLKQISRAYRLIYNTYN